jgi:hypothetical protein
MARNQIQNTHLSNHTSSPSGRKKNMYDIIFVGAFVAFWLLLQMVILPRFGVRT